MKNEFIKFYIQIFKWSKEINDVHYLDITFIKSASVTVFLNQINMLLVDIKKKILLSNDVYLIDSLTMIEESMPNKG